MRPPSSAAIDMLGGEGERAFALARRTEAFRDVAARLAQRDTEGRIRRIDAAEAGRAQLLREPAARDHHPARVDGVGLARSPCPGGEQRRGQLLVVECQRQEQLAVGNGGGDQQVRASVRRAKRQPGDRGPVARGGRHRADPRRQQIAAAGEPVTRLEHDPRRVGGEITGRPVAAEVRRQRPAQIAPHRGRPHLGRAHRDAGQPFRAGQEGRDATGRRSTRRPAGRSARGFRPRAAGASASTCRCPRPATTPAADSMTTLRGARMADYADDAASGSATLSVVPSPGALSTRIVPSQRLTMP